MLKYYSKKFFLFYKLINRKPKNFENDLKNVIICKSLYKNRYYLPSYKQFNIPNIKILSTI